MLKECDVMEVVKKFVRSIQENNDYWECNTCYPDNEFAEFSKTWDRVLEGYFFCPYDLSGFVEANVRGRTMYFPTSLYKSLISKYGEDRSAVKGMNKSGVQVLSREPSPKESAMINRVFQYFKNCEVDIEIEVKTARVSNSSGYFYEKGVLYVDAKNFTFGNFVLAANIFKRQIQKEADDSDQDYNEFLLTKFMSYIGENGADVI